jgi:outer membrane lipoprotein-sorting protein
MKRVGLLFLILVFLLSACAPAAPEAPTEVLVVTNGVQKKTYTAAMLEKLGSEQASFRDIAYLGVPLSTLLKDAGYDPAALKAVKAVAVDGFSVNYEPALFSKTDTLVAYARTSGPLADDEKLFRMVLPDQEGKLNPRQLVEIVVVQ